MNPSMLKMNHSSMGYYEGFIMVVYK
jgi:hypothetical protein